MKEIPNLFKAISQVLREARAEANVSQRDLAKRMECARSFIEGIENQQYQPSLQTFLLISENLGIPPEDMVKRIKVKLLMLEAAPVKRQKKPKTAPRL